VQLYDSTGCTASALAAHVERRSGRWFMSRSCLGRCAQEEAMPEHVRTNGEQHVEATPSEARQGTGPRDMVSVLSISLLLAAVAGAVLIAFFLRM